MPSWRSSARQARERFRIRDGVGLADPGQIADLGYEILADALHQPGTRRRAGHAGFHVVGEHRARGSASTISTAGAVRAKNRDMPVSVPPVPTPQTMASS